MRSLNKFRYWLSIILTELPDYLIKLNHNNNDWLYLKNRKQKAIPSPAGTGLCFLDDFTSQLRATTLFPRLSNKVFKKALDNNDFLFSSRGKNSHSPLVSYIIGHRGEDKIQHLLSVIKSIAAQTEDSIECIVIEQSSQPQVRDHLPDWVNYYHLQTEDTDLYNRSLSLNYGSKKANGQYLVLHDNDLLIPAGYTKSHVELLDQGYDIANLKRFIFGLNKVDTNNIFNSNKIDRHSFPEYVLQNAKGGGSLFIKKSAYQAIGGFDERFVGWGGEDNEFWQRAQILKIYPFAKLSMIHLWHEPQTDKRGGKYGGGLYTETLLDELSTVSIYNRINSLKNI